MPLLSLPPVAIGPNLVPLLERCVRGTVVSRGWEEKSIPDPLPRMPERPDPDAGLRRLLNTARVLELGRKLCDEQLQISVLHSKRPMTELAAEFGLTLREAQMCVRVFLLCERGQISKGADLEWVEREAGIRDSFGFVREEFR